MSLKDRVKNMTEEQFDVITDYLPYINDIILRYELERVVIDQSGVTPHGYLDTEDLSEVDNSNLLIAASYAFHVLKEIGVKRVSVKHFNVIVSDGNEYAPLCSVEENGDKFLYRGPGSCTVHVINNVEYWF